MPNLNMNEVHLLPLGSLEQQREVCDTREAKDRGGALLLTEGMGNP